MFYAISGTILSVLISISLEIFTKFTRSWALNYSKFIKEETYNKLKDIKIEF